MSLAKTGLVMLTVLTAASGCRSLMDTNLKSLLGVIDRQQVKSIHPRIADIDLQKVTLAFDVDVENPYPFPLKSPQFRYGLDIEGAEFVNANKAVALDIPAKGVGTVSLPIDLSYSELRKTYKELAGAKEIAYRLHGALVLAGGKNATRLPGKIELPMSKSGTFPVLRLPKFSNLDADFSDISLSSAKVALTADVLNPNIFPVGIEDVGYALKIGEVSVGDLVATANRNIKAGESGKLKLTGRISAFDGLLRLVRGKSIGAPNLLRTAAVLGVNCLGPVMKAGSLLWRGDRVGCFFWRKDHGSVVGSRWKNCSASVSAAQGAIGQRP